MTRTYQPTTRLGLTALLVLACLLLAIPSRAAAPVVFTSAYTDLNTQCRYARSGAEGSDAPMICPGQGGYRLTISFSAFAADVLVESRDGRFSRPIASDQAPNYAREKGRKAEWRLANGKPFAVILRTFAYRSNDLGEPDFSKKVGEKLVVKGLEGFEHIDVEVDARTTPNANARARQLADEHYAK
ncbi:MAG: hypothetical protein SNJ49_06595 [Chloracidobacterium sp.]